MSQPNQRQPVNKYDLRRQLYQAIETQFQHVPVPLKRKIQKLSNDQLEQAVDGIPMRDSIDSVFQLVQTLLDTGPPAPMQEGDRPSYPKQRSFQSDSSPRREPETPRFREDPPRRPVPSKPEPERNVTTRQIKAKPVEVIQEKVTDSARANESPVEVAAPVPPSVLAVQKAADPIASQKGMMIPIQLEESVITLETALTAGANDQNQRGLQFQFQMGETEFISAQFIAQRGHIQSLESRVAKAVEGFFSEAQHILNRI